MNDPSPVRDLLVTAHTPVLGSGRALRTYGVARALAAHRGLDLLYARFEGDAPDSAFAAIPGIELHAAVPSRGPRRLVAYAAARAAGVPDELARGVSSELSTWAARLAATPYRGRVIADGPTVAAALRGLMRRREVIYNAHNLESGFRHELGQRDPSAQRTLRRFERRLLGDAAESWMVSHADVEAAQALCPPARLRYVPNVIDVEAIAPIERPSAEPRVLFVANFTYEPNRNALEFLRRDVMPRVWAELPAARLVLVGVGLTAQADPRLETLGFVPELRAAYAGARGVVVPLLQGGGTPLKLIEALAYGMPVVATPRAVAGLDLGDGVHCLIAEGAAAFADALLRVLRHDDCALGSHGRELVRERYSIEALATLLDDGARP